MKKIIITAILIICLFNTLNDYVKASDKSNNYKQLVKDAFHTQVALSEKERSLSDVNKMLNVYFTKGFTALFIKENLVKTDNGYQTFGSDFPLYYIPFFSYDNNTKVKKYRDAIYVFEDMSEKDSGPVVFKNEYQGVRLIKEHQKWKIDEILYQVPKKIVQASKQKNNHETNTRKSITTNLTSLISTPFTFFIIPTSMKPLWMLISKI